MAVADRPEGAGRTGVSVTLFGTRGTLSASGEGFDRYGNRTICIGLVVTPPDAAPRHLLFDAGSGLLAACRQMQAKAVRDFDLFFSHAHYDHVIGLPMLKQFYDPDCSIRLWSGQKAAGCSTSQLVAGLMRAPYFPIGPEMFRARIDYHDFCPGERLCPQPGIEIATAGLNHPGGAVGYRIEVAGRVIAIVTDTEHVPGLPDRAVLGLIAGADLMLYDANCTDEEMECYRGWGHSSWQEALRLGQAAGVARIGMIHHSPWRDDAQLDRIAAALPEGAFIGRDGQTLEL